MQEGEFTFVLVFHYPTQFLFDNKLIFLSLSLFCPWQELISKSLSWSWPTLFFIFFSPPVLLRRGTERAAGWVSHSWPRLTRDTNFLRVLFFNFSLSTHPSSSPSPPPAMIHRVLQFIHLLEMLLLSSEKGKELFYIKNRIWVTQILVQKSVKFLWHFILSSILCYVPGLIAVI